jgi:hypothetical protein
LDGRAIRLRRISGEHRVYKPGRSVMDAFMYALVPVRRAVTLGLPEEYDVREVTTTNEIGVLLCRDDDGSRRTRLADGAYTRLLLDAIASDDDVDITIPPGAFPIGRPGWPGDWDEWDG